MGNKVAQNQPQNTISANQQQYWGLFRGYSYLCTGQAAGTSSTLNSASPSAFYSTTKKHMPPVLSIDKNCFPLLTLNLPSGGKHSGFCHISLFLAMHIYEFKRWIFWRSTEGRGVFVWVLSLNLYSLYPESLTPPFNYRSKFIEKP